MDSFAQRLPCSRCPMTMQRQRRVKNTQSAITVVRLRNELELSMILFDGNSINMGSSKVDAFAVAMVILRDSNFGGYVTSSCESEGSGTRFDAAANEILSKR